MKTLAVLPSRYASSRFPGKPLALIAGRPMIQWAWEAARAAEGVDLVVVATDDERIKSCAEAFGGLVVMTGPDLPSGTDRVAAAMESLNESFDVVVNIQGDEPAMHPGAIAAVVKLMQDDPRLPMATASCPFSHPDDVFNPNAVKVVVNDLGYALYFSRSPIPYVRNSKVFEADFRPWMEPDQLKGFRLHLGIYAYRPEVLKRFTKLPPHPLEKVEMLEQLRALGAGITIGVAQTQFPSVGVDTPADVPAAEAALRARGRLG